ncbi:MAG: S46 family peptidase [Paludibacter sp.]
MKFRLIIFLFIVHSFPTKADSGMWLPLNISQNISEMKKAGLKLGTEDIYSINKVCLKDAVLGLSTEDNSFDSFCSASFISDKGLVVTNYHPMIRYLEELSNADRDFLKFGYWATKQEEETNCRGLQVIQLVKLIDVTNELSIGTDTLDANEEDAFINKKAKQLISLYTKGTKTEGKVTSFMGGNQFVLSIYRIYQDVRMVAAPPMALGKFAGDADNWTWPRHTADFSLLRVYVNEKNEPAKYSKENVPLKDNPYLKVSTAGVKENDFVMTIGYPARTKLYIPSFAIDFMENTDLPARIKIRGEKLRIINQALDEKPEIKFRYTARVNSITNNYLRWKGELNGLKRMQLTQQKVAEEKELMEWINADTKRKEKYGDIIEIQRKIYDDLKPYKVADIYFNESGINGAEIVPFAGKFEKLVQMFHRKNVNEKAVAGEVKRLIPLAEMFFKNWDYELDRQMYRNMFYLYYQNVDKKFIAPQMSDALSAYDGDVDKYATAAFEKSILTHPELIQKFLTQVDSTSMKTLTSDPVYKLALSFYSIYTEKVLNQMNKLNGLQSKYYSVYIDAIVEKNIGKTMSSDANRTQRLSYGTVKGCIPANGMQYNYYTTLDGVFEKRLNNPGNPDYYIPKKIIELYNNKDLGKYAVDGTIRTCFLTNCHTTSANSGSPVLNAKGQLVGLNFDRMAEGVASDYKYLPELSRSIVMDIRYMLFILEKYAPSKQLLDEIKFVK